MKKTKLQSISNKVSKAWSVPLPIITRKKQTPNGYIGYEIRTELPSYEGGEDLQIAIEKVYHNIIVENQGGCIYFVYRP